MNITKTQRIALRIKPLAAAVALLAIAGQAAAVGNGTVAAGAATIGSNGATTTINQSSNRAILNWNNFDIGASERVQINQPNAGSAILNRVNSSKLTQIDGALNSNGRVFVVNPNGIVVGKSGQIDASSVVLSTLNIDETGFMNSDAIVAGDLNSLAVSKKPGAASATVTNSGTINAPVGATLLGGQVVNTGEITSAGQITLAAGDAGNLNHINSPSNALNGVTITEGNTRNAITNQGSLTSTDGTVSVQSLSGNTLLGGTVTGKKVEGTYGENLLVDGTVRATDLDDSSDSVNFITYKLDSTLSVGPKGRISGNVVNLSGDKVEIDGTVAADTTIHVTAATRYEIRDGALETPFYRLYAPYETQVGSYHP